MPKQIEVDAEITVKVRTKIILDKGESVLDFSNRFADIYLHGAGEHGSFNKEDLGGNATILVHKVTEID